jgi:2OG-Fe(II) oxygenase superfamily
VVANRRWERRAYPFKYVIARNVFTDAFYRRLEAAFRKRLGERSGGYLKRHDIHGCTLTKAEGPLGLFASRGWHDMLARLLGIPATGEVNIGLHHHEPGSANGFPHNDLNPGWFAVHAGPNGTGVHLTRPDLVEYTSGRVLHPTAGTHETVRAAACIFYLNNPPWRPGDGGSTGIYRAASDQPNRPAAVVPPINNSLLAFECTPYSYHGFISNRMSPRDSVVIWLHREKKDALERWGEHAIVPYGGSG